MSHRWILSAHKRQICTATSRILVQASIYEKFIEAFKERIKTTSVIGDPFAEGTFQGPQVTKAQYDRVMSYIETGMLPSSTDPTITPDFSSPGKSEGATLAYGGTAHAGPGGKGFFVEPTVFRDVTDSMHIVQEEIFGPLVVVSSFKDEEEALARANSTMYGLGSAVFTTDLVRAHRVAREIEAGMVWVNSTQDSDFRVPFGGSFLRLLSLCSFCLRFELPSSASNRRVLTCLETSRCEAVGHRAGTGRGRAGGVLEYEGGAREYGHDALKGASGRRWFWHGRTRGKIASQLQRLAAAQAGTLVKGVKWVKCFTRSRGLVFKNPPVQFVKGYKMAVGTVLAHTTIGYREFPYPFDHGRKTVDRRISTAVGDHAGRPAVVCFFLPLPLVHSSPSFRSAIRGLGCAVNAIYVEMQVDSLFVIDQWPNHSRESHLANPLPLRLRLRKMSPKVQSLVA